MSRRALALAAVGAAAVVVTGSALAVVGSVPASRSMSTPWSGEVVPAPAPDLPDDPATARLLQRAVRAAGQVSYTGLAAVQEWGAEGGVGRVVEVDRVAGVGTRVRVRGSMDEPLVTSDRGVPSVAPGDTGRMLGLLARNYAVSRGSVERVAGRSAVVVEARRADGSVAARLWLDRSTGLVLRRELYDATGRTVQSAGFLRLALAAGETGPAGTDPGPAEELSVDGSGTAPTSGVSDTTSGSPSVESWTESVDPAALRSWRERGWACPEALPDGLTLVGARRGEADGVDVLQLVYSDGLTTLSLFQQRGRLAPESLAGFRSADIAGVGAWTRPGAPAQVVWQAGDSVLTLVADAPSDVVASVVAALPGAAATPDGLMDRIARGWSRVVDAVTP